MKIALTNVPPDHAQSIANALVEEQLAACINLYPVKSVYRWKGELCRDDEVTLMIKVAAEGVAPLKARLLELHPYELMEFVVLDIDSQGSLAEYIGFVRAGTQAAQS
ncbi:MAG: divalent cation tolerance protein CutA [Myxococcota bacterium]